MRTVQVVGVAVVVLIVGSASVGAAYAQSVAFNASGVSSIGGATGAASLSIGPTFDVQNAAGITITSLGVFDAGSDGLSEAHPATLFLLNASGNAAIVETAVGSTTIVSGTGTPTGGSGSFGTFRFATLTSPIFLAQGSHAAVIAYRLSDPSAGPVVDRYADGFGVNPAGDFTWTGFDACL